MRSTNNALLFFVLLVFTSFSSPVLSASPAASQDAFNTGSQSFMKGDYAGAVKAFKKAEAQGVRTPALYYNLASSYYKLGDYKNSKKYFNKVRNYKGMRYLAEYNLGLIALYQNEIKTADAWFSNVAKKSKDKKLSALAQKKRKDIKSQKKPRWVTKKWSSYLSASLGYDSNVNFAPLGISNEISSRFTEFVASGDYLFSGDRRNGWLAEGYFYSIKYYDVDLPITDIYDEYEFGAGIKKYLQLNRDWQTLYSLDMSKINYGGEAYQTIAKAGAEVRNTLSKNERIILRYAYEDINSDKKLFDYLEGWRQKLRAEYRLYRKHDRSRLYYELELNNRNDLTIAPPSVRAGLYSYSPTRHTIRGRYTQMLNQNWHLTGDLSYRASDYPTTANQDRQDDRYKAAMYADYRFTRDLKLRAKIEYTDNRSTENIFAYKRTIYTVGINALF